MDIYLFGFIIFTIGCLVITILVMYEHSHKLQAELRDMDEELEGIRKVKTPSFHASNTAHKEEISKLQTDFSYYVHFLEQMLYWHCIEYDKPPHYKKVHDLVDSIIEDTNGSSMVEANSWFNDYYYASEYKGNQT